MDSRRFSAFCRTIPVAFAMAVLSGCSGKESTPRPDTTVSLPNTPGSVSAANMLAAVWDTAAGSVFAISGPEPSEAYVIDPTYIAQQRLDTIHVELSAAVGMDLDLFAAGDSVGSARITAVVRNSPNNCAMWPLARLVGSGNGPISHPWSLGFPRGRARGVPFDSLPELSHADSLRLTIEIARAASKIPGDTAAVFRGRPYVVRQANTFRLASGQPAVLAEVIRVVNQEANPVQEQLVLVLEAEKEQPNANYAVGYAERTIGLEEALESLDLISPMLLRNGTWALLVRREVGDGSRLVLLERITAGRWEARWRSAYAGC